MRTYTIDTIKVACINYTKAELSSLFAFSVRMYRRVCVSINED